MLRIGSLSTLLLTVFVMGAFVDAQETKTQGGFYELQFYKITQGDQGRRFGDWARKVIPILNRHGAKPVGVFSVVIGPDTPAQVLLVPHKSLAAAQELWEKVGDDADYQAALETWEDNPEQPFVTLDTVMLRATDYSPPLEASADGEPRYFELRVYHSPSQRQLKALHERFGGPEIKIFHRVGIVPILYGETVAGDNMPNLTYLTPFKSLADREAAWTRFGADPEWQVVRDESIKRSGQIVRNINFWILRAGAYSQIQ